MYENIPQELKQLNRWVCWKLEERDGKPTKVPVNPKTGGRAMSNNPDTWGSFETALECHKKYNLQGVGFMFNGDGIVGVDIDGCRDPETGTLTAEARDIIYTLESYTELSQSGTGIHIICKGRLPEGKRRHGKVEMYETGRFFIMTGNVLDDGHTEIEERTAELAQIHAKYVADKPKKTKKAAPQTEITLNDEAIINKASNAKNGYAFQELMAGRWEGNYSSQSEADLALCNILAFYTKDSATINRIFRRSGLYRDKWDEARPDGTYGSITIMKAINDVTETYTPKKAKQEKQLPEPPEMDLGYDQLYGKPVESIGAVADKNPIDIPGGVFIEDGVYKKVKYNKDSKEVIILSNFVLRPIKLIRFEHCNILTVEIKCTTGKTYIKDIDIKNFTSVVSFKKALGELLVFNGKDTELEAVKALILNYKYPEVEGISYTGFIKKNGKWLFASSDGVVNETMEKIEDITVSVTEGNSTILKEEDISKKELEELAEKLFKFNKPGIAGTVIGWTASLFIREKLWESGRIKHPHLLIIGEAGSGKSETVENIVMPILCMDGQPMAAGQVTRFSAMKNASASNFVPYIIGEYKPPKLPDWILREISELLRNTYDRQEGQRGTTEQVLITYPYRSPILLIGEGSPTHETAVKERSMQLFLSKRDSIPYSEGYHQMKQCRNILGKLGRLLLKTALSIDDNKFVTWQKKYCSMLSDIYDERIKQGIAVVCTGLSLIQKAFKDAGVYMNLDDILNETVNQLKLDIYENQEPKSDVIYTLELFDQLADIGVLVEGVHYKRIQGTDELALCVSRIYARAKEYCSKTRTELQQQKDFMSQIRRHECFVKDKRSVKLYDLSKTQCKPVSCLILNLNNLKADIPTLAASPQKDEDALLLDEIERLNPFVNGEQQKLM